MTTASAQRLLFGVNIMQNSLTDDRTLHCESLNASMESYFAWTQPLGTSHRLKPKWPPTNCDRAKIGKSIARADSELGWWR